MVQVLTGVDTPPFGNNVLSHSEQFIKILTMITLGM